MQNSSVKQGQFEGFVVKNILNQIEKHVGFVYESVRWAQSQGIDVLEVLVRPQANSRPICSGCKQP